IVGSGINIPVAHIRSMHEIKEPQTMTFFGVRYVVPRMPVPRTTVLAVNVGGAIVPTALAGYLMVHDQLGPGTLLAIGVVTLAVHMAAYPVEGVGIAVPGLVAPLVAAGMAIVLGGPSVPAVAYVSGVLGSLLGADILNLGRIKDLGAPVASIGGAGTF